MGFVFPEHGTHCCLTEGAIHKNTQTVTLISTVPGPEIDNI